MGFSAHANKVIKANRTLLKKRRSFLQLRKTYEGYEGETKLSFTQLTDLEHKN